MSSHLFLNLCLSVQPASKAYLPSEIQQRSEEKNLFLTSSFLAEKRHHKQAIISHVKRSVENTYSHALFALSEYLSLIFQRTWLQFTT